jgi:regulator of cell morphogenesis and NO signaling
MTPPPFDSSDDPTLAQLVTAQPAAARVLERHHLDYCCGGPQALSSACAAVGVDPAAVLDEIRTLESEPSPEWATMTPAALADHLEATHHRYLRAELPRLSDLAAKVAGVSTVTAIPNFGTSSPPMRRCGPTSNRTC